MACWLEYYTCEVAIQKRVNDVWGGIVDGTRRVWVTPIFVTDDTEAFNAVRFGQNNRLTVEEGNRRFDVFASYWGLSPKNIMRYGIFRDATQEAEARGLNEFDIEWFNYKEIYSWTEADVAAGIGNNRFVFRSHEDTWISCGSIITGWYPQMDACPAATCSSNYSRPRQSINWFVLLRNADGDMQSLYGSSMTADPTGGYLNIWGWVDNFDSQSDIWKFFQTHLPWNGSDPYDGVIPTTGAEGGQSTGSGITPSEPVPEPDPLTASSADTGFTRIYNPSLSQLQVFARYMWTDTNILQTVWNHVKQYFEDPMDAFIALNLLPVSVPSSGSEEVRLLFINTGKYMNVASNQFVTVELGELTLNEAYGSALDYAPNTQIDLFLPYIGTVSIDADEVMGRRVKLTYKVDICTGVCVAILKVELDVDGGKAFFPLYQFTGNCAIRIPFTAANMDGYINAALNAAKIAAVAAGAGLASVAAGAGTAAMTTTSAANAGTALSTEVASHAPITPATLAAGFPALRLGDAAGMANYNASLFNAAATGMKQVPSAIGIRAAMKPRFEKSSGFVGNSGYMSYKVPFFIMKVPRMVNPAEYGKYNGYPSLSYQSFSALNGYAEIQQVQLTNINATANELDEIQSMLKSGVIM